MPLDTTTEPLTSFAETLVNAERERLGPSPDLEARLWGRISATVAVPPLPTPASPTARVTFPGAAAGLPAKVLVGAMLAAAGAGAGGATVAALKNRELAALLVQLEEARTARINSEAPPPSAPVLAVPSAPPPPASAPEPEKAHPLRPSPRPAHQVILQPAPRAETPLSELGQEAALIDRSRTALFRNDAPGAWLALEEHARRFPKGQHMEEREALRVQTLVFLNRRAEAEAAAKAFRQQFPESLLLPSVDAILATPVTDFATGPKPRAPTSNTGEVR